MNWQTEWLRSRATLLQTRRGVYTEYDYTGVITEVQGCYP